MIIKEVNLILIIIIIIIKDKQWKIIQLLSKWFLQVKIYNFNKIHNNQFSKIGAKVI